MNPPKTFSLEVTQRAPQLLRLLAYDVRAEISVRAVAVSLMAKLLRQIKNDGDRNTVKLPSEGNDWVAGFGLHIRGIDHYQFASRQPFGNDEIQNLKGIVRGRLAVLLVGYETTAEV